MNREEEEKYLDTWGPICLLCNKHVEREDRRVVKAIVPLSNLPEHAAGPVTKYYMVCSNCKENGELI